VSFLTSRLPGLLAAAALAVGAGAARAQAPVPQNVMSLSATATSDVGLDLLSITFSTTREGADAAVVQSQLKLALDTALVEARRIAKPGLVDVQTGSFALYPRYAPKGGINGWQGTAQLVVEGRDMAAISQLASRITTLTIARTGYGLSREARERAEAETTAQAIARFRERAQQQSAQFGFAGYTIREVQVGTQESPPPMPVMAMRAKAMAAPPDEALPVEAGKTTVSTTVSGSVVMTR
jgi:predicted secreted protein